MVNRDALKQYAVITGNYWAFTLTDGALRMLVVLYFHQLGYNALEVASLFLFYELFGVITNLFGGWLGARVGLNKTMNLGLVLQIMALSILLVPNAWLTVPVVMAAQALSGIAKDLNKMSAKSAIKLFIPENQDQSLYRWVARLTGSKNALKGVGFFFGGLLLTTVGFTPSILILLSLIILAWIVSLLLLKAELGKKKNKPKFKELFSKSHNVNRLSAARLLLFGARDVWFVVAIPVYFAEQLHWSYTEVGSFMAAWVIGYGFVQTVAPRFTRAASIAKSFKDAQIWVGLLAILPFMLAWALELDYFNESVLLLVGLLIFGAVFAINSSLHSYLIVKLADKDGVSLDVGFYYMSNAAGRLLGTILSGWAYLEFGLEVCLLISSVMLVGALIITLLLRESKVVT
ncbi:organoarsenical effux MFS transporter ArsJ [Pseudoalteromonas xiamenensis]|uniref:Organoarsenical effux MFS transporter ArsJ n=1 Tax=Pseudoalteromonas xiamenensis TaxID=882626 RepID=A0A975HL22_9GAMM|nr:organoarsenical effux MFS transporter ArsJ [Pseudoalteromonas xiamenensis]QTH71633.1 organoarsenical effux MFS transporter ArsJ [Pseudoalteromonas xiamenensis]